MTTVTQSPARQLATVETVLELAPIEGADSIVRARIRGWDVVVKLGEFTVGDVCVYLEVDSLVDVTDPRFEFLAPRGVRTDADGHTGHVLATARFRGQYSQGLALPLASFPELAGCTPGEDVTDRVAVIKWDQPIPANLLGTIRGYLPDWVPATSEVRIQNGAGTLTATDLTWVATEKIDGESTTYFVDPTAEGDLVTGACTRNVNLMPSTNVIWTNAAALRIHEQLTATFPGVRAYVQGETFGAGVKKNPLRLADTRFAAYNLRVDGVDVPRGQWPAWLLAIAVPVREDLTYPVSTDQALADVERLASKLNPTRAAEGAVWRTTTGGFVHLPDGQMVPASFKVVSNHYLRKNEQ